MNPAATLTARPWLRSFGRPAHARVRLICFPHAGGTANFYRPWRNLFAADVELQIVQYPGREDRMREPFETDAGRIAATVADEIAAATPVATLLFGHSMGAILAYETALKLQDGGSSTPAALILSSSVAPQIPRHMRRLLEMDSTDLRTEVHGWGGMPNAVLEHDDLWNFIEPRFRADLTAMDNYRPVPDARLQSPLHVVYSRSDRLVDPAGMANWRRHTQASFSLHELPGDHISILEAIPSVIEAIARPIA
jgi:surfactin synthase thioesterase subunit